MSIRELLIDLAIKFGVTIVSVIVTLFLSLAKNSKNNRLRAVAQKIAETVEQLYAGCGSEEKLAAFKELCRAKKINVDKAVKYLESVIMPISKSINILPEKLAQESVDDDDEVI